MRKYSTSYVDELLAKAGYADLVELSSVICSSTRFKADAPDYGLPEFAFVFVEALAWFAQAIRSGVWTYYEATTLERQAAMLGALRTIGPAKFAEAYESGCLHWRDEQSINVVDKWIEANEEVAANWLHSLARTNRQRMLDLTA